ncbi:MAG: hypothetical protein JKY66_08940 [Spongiibacteraceae bacterium]|nr:hypothetical protein [Spongiibacteraceae bacterium]
MPSFNTELETLFPYKETVVDFSGTLRIFDIYIREMCPDDYMIVAQDRCNSGCTFEVTLHASLHSARALLKREIVQTLCSPHCQASLPNTYHNDHRLANTQQPPPYTTKTFPQAERQGVTL